MSPSYLSYLSHISVISQSYHRHIPYHLISLLRTPQVNMQKRTRYFNATQTMDLDFAKRWLGLFQPAFPCPKPERLGDYGDGGKVRTVGEWVHERNTIRIYSF